MNRFNRTITLGVLTLGIGLSAWATTSTAAPQGSAPQNGGQTAPPPRIFTGAGFREAREARENKDGADTAGTGTAGATSRPAEPHARMRMAIHALREVKHHLEDAPHDFGGHKADAIKSVDEAIKQLEEAVQYDKENEHDGKGTANTNTTPKTKA